MSDSGRFIGQCPHGNYRERCEVCLLSEAERAYHEMKDERDRLAGENDRLRNALQVIHDVGNSNLRDDPDDGDWYTIEAEARAALLPGEG